MSQSSIPVQAPTRPWQGDGAGRGPGQSCPVGGSPMRWAGGPGSWLSPRLAGSLAARGPQPAPRGEGYAPRILLRAVQPEAQLHPRAQCWRVWEVPASSRARQPLLPRPEHACQIPCGHPTCAERQLSTRAPPNALRTARPAHPCAPAGSTAQTACLLSTHPTAPGCRLWPSARPTVHSLRPGRPSQGPGPSPRGHIPHPAAPATA